jgi:long-chain acyl-CoA synthetase
MSKLLSVEVSGTLTEEETPVRRNSKTKDALVTQPFEGIDTVTDVLFYAARTHGAKDAFGTRDILNIHEEEKTVKKTVDGKEKEEKKKWKYFELGTYEYLSFQQVKTTAVEIANAFIELGLKKGDIFNIYAQTRSVSFFMIRRPNTEDTLVRIGS